MPDILTSDELNDLLAAVDGGEGEEEAIVYHDKMVAPYDFERPARLSRAQVKQLQRLYESALEGLTGVLSEHLRTPMEANVLGVRAVNFGSFTNILPTPTYVNIFRIKPYGYRGVLTLDIPFCLALVDRLLGGHGHTTEEPRNLTSIEIAVLDWPATMILDQLRTCWRGAQEIEFARESVRMDLNFAQIMHNSETVLRVTFALGGEIGSGEAHFCVPFTVLEQARLLERLREEALGSGSASEIDRQRARENIRSARIGLAAEIGTANLTIGEVLRLKPGQVVRLAAKAREPIVVKVGGKPKFLARPGQRSRSAAVKIEQVLHNT